VIEGIEMYRITDVDFSYGMKQVLSDLNVVIEEKTFWAIIGPNGAGKTTMMHLLSGFLKPGRGEILFQNRNLSSYGSGELGKQVAVVPQEVMIRFPFSCFEVVMMGRTPFKNRMERPTPEDLDIVHRSMKSTETLEFADKLITELSGGEKQRVILAKALAQTPSVLLLDEAFSSMDIHYMVKFLSMVKELVYARGLTVVVIMHDLHMASIFSDRVIALDGGRIERFGSTERVMTPEFINSLFRIQVEQVGERGLVVLPGPYHE
jgi:iron complex transport system ATP-binding protein